MAGSRQTNTMTEFYNRTLGEIGKAKAQPDADLQSLIDLETLILGQIHAPDALGQSQAIAGGGGPSPGPPMGPGMGGPPMGGGGGPVPVMPGGPPGTPVGGGFSPPGMGMMTNPDEMRRMLGG